MASFKTILVPVDYSARSLQAFRVACSLAEEGATRLIVLHVVEQLPVMEQLVGFDALGTPIPLDADGSPHHNAIQERLREVYVSKRPIDVRILVRDAEAAEGIVGAADDVGADLIVLGTHGRTGLNRLLAGSVAEAVLRRATCPVLAVHSPESGSAETGAAPIQVILHPTDFSDQSQAALEVARALAKSHSAHLLLLHVDPIEMMSGVALAPPVPIRKSYYATADGHARKDRGPRPQVPD